MYTVRKEKYGYSVWKWEDSSFPTSQYRITSKGCDCPAGYRRRCKHFDLIDSFKELEPGAWAFEFKGKNIQPVHLSIFDTN